MKLHTPFYGKHVESKAKFLKAPGFYLQVPESFTTVEEEVRMVRERAGFIDYTCLQGKLVVLGKDARELLQKLLVNDINKIEPGRALYSMVLDGSGKIIDDLILNWEEDNVFALETGATEATFEWLNHQATGMDVYIVKMNEAKLSLQGPKSKDVLQKAVDVSELKYFSFMHGQLRDIPVRIARLGFTGERGYELTVAPEYAHALWDALIELGKEFDVGPYGLMAGRVCATEKGYLWGLDFYEGSSPLELGLGWMVAFDKGDFFGRQELIKRKEEGLKTKLMGFELPDEKSAPPIGAELVLDSKNVGGVNKSFYGYTLQKMIGTCRVQSEVAEEGRTLEAVWEDGRTTVTLRSKKWYDPENKRVKE